MYVGNPKTRRNVCVVKGIDQQRENKGKNNRTIEDGGFLSLMSVTRSKQGLEEGGGKFFHCV